MKMNKAKKYKSDRNKSKKVKEIKKKTEKVMGQCVGL
jgi:hypothetical protein